MRDEHERLYYIVACLPISPTFIGFRTHIRPKLRYSTVAYRYRQTHNHVSFPNVHRCIYSSIHRVNEKWKKAYECVDIDYAISSQTYRIIYERRQSPYIVYVKFSVDFGTFDRPSPSPTAIFQLCRSCVCVCVPFAMILIKFKVHIFIQTRTTHSTHKHTQNA